MTYSMDLRGRGVAAAGSGEAIASVATFLGHVPQRLAPSLRPGDVVVMDNLASHKVSGVG